MPRDEIDLRRFFKRDAKEVARELKEELPRLRETLRRDGAKEALRLRDPSRPTLVDYWLFKGDHMRPPNSDPFEENASLAIQWLPESGRLARDVEANLVPLRLAYVRELIAGGMSEQAARQAFIAGANWSRLFVAPGRKSGGSLEAPDQESEILSEVRKVVSEQEARVKAGLSHERWEDLDQRVVGRLCSRPKKMEVSARKVRRVRTKAGILGRPGPKMAHSRPASARRK